MFLIDIGVKEKLKISFLGQFLTLKNMVAKFFRNSNFSSFLFWICEPGGPPKLSCSSWGAEGLPRTPTWGAKPK